jgi:hypothetical protein
MQSAPRTPTPWWRDAALRRLLLLALGLRLVVGSALWLADPTCRALYSDPEYYQRWAAAWAAGQDHEPGLPFWLPPGYPALLALVFRLFGEGLGAVLLLQLGLGLVATLRLVRLVELCSGRAAALWAGGLWSLYLPVVFYETRLLSESLATLLAILALERLVRAERALATGQAGANRAAGWGGLLTGLAALLRPNLMLHAPLAIAGLWLATRGAASAGRRAALAACVALGLAAGLLPGLAANWMRSGQPVLVSANGGVNFWFGNQASSRGTFVAPGPEWGAIAEQRGESLRLAAAGLGLEQVDERRASRWFFAQGWDYLRADPGRWAELWGRKLAAQLSSTEWGIMYSPHATRRFVPWLWLLPLPFGVLLLLAALGAPAQGRGALLGWLIGGLLATLLYFTYSRFRLPWLPALMPFVGAGAARLAALARERRLTELRPAAFLLRLLLGGLLLLQSGFAFEGPYKRQLEAHALVDAAQSALRLGRPPERARALFQRALELVPGEVGAWTGLGQLHLSAGDLPAAREAFQRAVAIGLDHWPAQHGLISTRVLSPYPTQREPERALAEAEAWLASHGPGSPGRAEFLALAASIALDSLAPPDTRRAGAWLAELRRDRADFPGLAALETALETARAAAGAGG